MINASDVQRAAKQVIRDHGSAAAETAARWAIVLRSANYVELAQTWERIAIAVRALEAERQAPGRLTRFLRFG
ncbi:MAG TPA: hypothetical protein VFA22_04160 [Stellaceae bacterium]|nr:hypothetical protein [Stellaceae bacterium]